MELKKHPETETEYFKCISFLSQFCWYAEHDAADSRINMNEARRQELKEAQDILKQLMSEAEERFGVIPPEKCPQRNKEGKLPKPPTGKKWFQDWYESMEQETLRLYFEELICSACPFSKGGIESFGGRDYPCGQTEGRMGIIDPGKCGMEAWRHWLAGAVYKEILEKFGEEALAKFRAKEAEIQAKAKKVA